MLINSGEDKMKRPLLASVLLLLVLAASAAWAQPPRQPQQSMFPEIWTAELKVKLDTKQNLFLVDSRTEGEYLQGHIPGAVNVPPERVNPIAGYLPKDKSVPVVFYCRGYG